MTATLFIHLLGHFRLIQGTVQVAGLHTARLQSLLAYLLLRCSAPEPRQQIAFQLWPDSTEGQARTNLRNLLHQLRHALPAIDQCLSAQGHDLQWLPTIPVCLDVAQFEAALARGAPAEAVAMYGGDLLPDCYDEWILADRDRLQQGFALALQRLIQALEAQHDYAAAIAPARLLLQQDLLREAAYRQLMRLHALNGDRAAAVRVYHDCAAMLQRELAVAPSRLTREAYERVLAAEPADAREAALLTDLPAAPSP